MIVHRNPMMEQKNGDWIDTHLDRVLVRPTVLNHDVSRNRWEVFTRRKNSGSFSYVSRHITLHQAVVSAQTLANRLKLQTDKKKRRQSARIKPVTLAITQADHKQAEDILHAAFSTFQTAPLAARQDAERLRRLLHQIFQL